MIIKLYLTQAEANLLNWMSNFNDVVKYPDDKGQQSETMESLGKKIRSAIIGTIDNENPQT